MPPVWIQRVERLAFSEPGRIAEQYRSFGRGAAEMLASTAKLFGLRLLDRLFDVRFSPYLKAIK